MVEKTLIPAKQYLQTGSHIGAKFKTSGMRKFIFKKRRDKLKVLDVGTIDERIRVAAHFLAQFEPEKVLVVSQKEYSSVGAEKFASLTGAKVITGRFVPGTLTNPLAREFLEPAVLLVTDPKIDTQPIKEATSKRIPIAALCSTDNSTKEIDLIIPINNKGRQSLALVFWLLAKTVLKERGELKKEGDFKEELGQFEFKPKEGMEAQQISFAEKKRFAEKKKFKSKKRRRRKR